ncbi:MAG: tRNA (adenosine(37)-N6)-dimethylallyltransferase MiaA, partial [Pelagibacteraceae bacterium]
AIFLAKKLNGEIINADSMQIYKEIKILSARPIKYKKIKHHFYGFFSVKKKFSTGNWLKLAEKKIRNILKRKKTPILVGGTGLYFKVITDGIAKIPNISQKKRNQIIKEFNQLGSDLFYKKLVNLDPKVKNIIKPNDKQRMIRFYEIKKFTNKSILDWQKNTKNYLSDLEFKKIYLNMPRENLLERIEARFKRMIKLGALSEVKKFKKLKLKPSLSANYILGIKEIQMFLDKEISLNEAINQSIIRTRQYVKRQLTWFRGQMKDWTEFNDINQANLRKKILKYIRTS